MCTLKLTAALMLQDILFPGDADAFSVDNDSAVSDVCSLAESQFQVRPEFSHLWMMAKLTQRAFL